MKKTNLVALPCCIVEDLLRNMLSGQASDKSIDLINAHIDGSAGAGIPPCKSCTLIRDVISDELESAGRDRHKGASPFQPVLLLQMRKQLHVLQWGILCALIITCGLLFNTPYVRTLELLLPIIGALGFLFTRKSWVVLLSAVGVPLVAAGLHTILKHVLVLSLPLALFCAAASAAGTALAFCTMAVWGHPGFFHSRYIRFKRGAVRLLAAAAALLLAASYVYLVLSMDFSLF